MSCPTDCVLDNSLWSSYGLPPPDIDGYSYHLDAGVVRTTYDDGTVRQRRRRPRGRRPYTLRWTVDAATLQTLELFLAAYGAEWFDLPRAPGALRLRIIGTLEIIGGDYNRLTVAVAAEAAATI